MMDERNEVGLAICVGLAFGIVIGLSLAMAWVLT
jgi:hypothetical protein